MLVQGEEDRTIPTKPTKPLLKKPPKTEDQNHHFSEPQNLGFPKWPSLNPLKVAAFFFLGLTVASLFFLLRSSDDSSAAFFCFNSRRPKTLIPLRFPKFDFESVQPNSDKSSPYSSFRSDRWIVVSVADYPSDPLRKLVRIKGWQVLAIGNSKTPSDWSLKGAIFLSLEDQASLNFRVLDHLPYDTHVRKVIGYLFAIQHGAKTVFDADDRAEVIGGDLGKHFDLKLNSVDVMQERILQYNNGKNPNRTVVNPYVHFGQRSVWPRGLPLESVGEVFHEEFYGQVFGGNQFIQQGLSNGLPDVDSFFYFTRKLGSETFDIRFDDHAPKVVLPRGLMAPINSFNTLFHGNAFWGLMLPVSVSSMASDVLRGYWAQRLLWEVGGSVGVYPPTVYRDDKVGGYPFIEEKDLHVNVGRLVKFLISWRSDKHELFEKIVELSFAMAKEGFWGEKDVKFTVSWLEDLVSVGYKQPKMKGVDLDKVASESKRVDLKEFVPRKLPSVHLGVKESETVNYEIGNLVRWRKSFGNIVLILFVNGSVEGTALEWRLLYGRVFKAVVILSEKANPEFAVEQASLDQAYKYLPKIFDRFTTAEGFLFLQDNTVLNYWNLHLADKSKLWITDKIPQSWTKVSINEKDSMWFSKQANMVKKVVSSMPVHFQVSYKSSVTNDQTLTLCNSEVFYVPRRFVGDFVDLVGLVGNYKMHHKVAIPMFFTAMDLPQQFDSIFSKMIYKPLMLSGNSSPSHYSVQSPAVYPWTVSDEVDFLKLIRLMASGDPLLMELV